MTVLVLGLVLFFVPHSVPVFFPGLRESAVSRLGERTWKGLYSLLSLAGLGLIVWGWMLFRPDAPDVYTPPDRGRDVTYIFVFLAFVLFSVPRSKPGRIMVLIKHPMMWGVILWAGGHLLANGDLASVLLFGSFLAYAIAGRLAEAVKGDPSPVFVSYRSDLIALGGGAVFYAVFVLWIHGFLFGVTPF